MTDPHSNIRIPRPETRWVMIAAWVVVLISSAPYAVVALTTPTEMRFAGALVTPIDGQSYFAKMRQGLDGAWLFRLPFTANDEPDALLFTFHIGLGHLARISGAELMAVYQAARLVGGWALLVVVYALIARVFDEVNERRRAWWFVALTAGLGWIAGTSSDVTIPESNTFFSVLTNAHFAASMALIIVIFMAVLDGRWRRAALASIGLAILQPFAPMAVYSGVLVSWMIGWAIGKRGELLQQVRVTIVAGLSLSPLLIYFYFATQRDPILQGWSAQNLTPSPPPIEYLLGYGLMGVLAILGARFALKRRREVDVLLVGWAISSALLLYAPFALQRRFSLGLHIPIVLLAVLVMSSVARPQLRKWLPGVVFALSLPTTLVLLFVTSTAALRPPDGRLFFSTNEAAAFDWLRDNVSHDSVVMAAPETDLFLPAWGDVRVIYGHPFETLNAPKMKALVEDFFTGRMDRATVLREQKVDYIFFGPRERRLGEADSEWHSEFSAGDVTIYRSP